MIFRCFAQTKTVQFEDSPDLSRINYYLFWALITALIGTKVASLPVNSLIQNLQLLYVTLLLYTAYSNCMLLFYGFRTHAHTTTVFLYVVATFCVPFLSLLCLRSFIIFTELLLALCVMYVRDVCKIARECEKEGDANKN